MQTLVYTIVLKDKIAKPDFILRAENLGIEVTGNWEFIPTVLAIRANKDQFEQIKTDSAIKSIELEQTATTCTVQNLANLQDHTDNWGLDRIDQTSPVLDSTYSYTRSATNVDAYVVDTGIKKDHKEFGGRVSFLYDSFQEAGLPDAEDGNGHGTHVAATLGGATYGVAKHVKIYAVKVLSSEGRGFSSHILNGLEAVYNHHNAKNTPIFTRPSIVNLSLSFTTIVPVIDLAIEALIDVGIVVCVAAGNSTVAAETISPASVPGAVTVGAIGTTGLEDYFASFSNYGSAIDINAPGVDIVSAYPKRSLFTSIAHTSQTENRLGIIGVDQTVFEISITVGYNSSPFVKIGTSSNPTLLLDAGPSGSNRPHVITQGRSSTFTLNVPFTTSEDLIIIVDKQGATAGSLGVSVDVSSKSANRRYNGTSMASPHVAGVIALRLQEETTGPLTPGEVTVIHDWVSDGSASVISGLPANTTNKIVNTPYIVANNIEWLTSAGRLTSVDEETYVNITVSAEYVNTLGNRSSVTNFTSDNLPTWLTLNQTTGQLTGTVDTVTGDTEITFSIIAEGDLNTTDTRSFSILILNTENQLLQWTTPAGSLGTIIEGNPTSNLPIQLQAYDPEGDPFTFEILHPDTQPLPNGLTIDSTGLISGTPGSLLEDQEYTFTIRITDGTGVNDRTFTLNQTANNTAPVWQPVAMVEPVALPSMNEGEVIAIDLASTGSHYALDPDGDTLSFSFNLQPGDVIPAGLVLSSEGVLSGIINIAGTYTFTINATDSILSANRQYQLDVINVPVNLPPSWLSPAGNIGEIDEGESSSFAVAASDPEGDPITYTLDLEPGDVFPIGLTLQVNGLITGIPADVATDTVYNFRIKASDDQGNDSFRRFYITVKNTVGNIGPVWSTPAGSLGEINEHVASLFGVQATDANNDTLTYSVVGGTLPPGLSLNPTTGNITGNAPDVGSDTIYTFTINVTDGSLSPTDRTFSITVKDVNADSSLRIRIPVFGPDQQMFTELSDNIITDDTTLFRAEDANFGIPSLHDLILIDGLLTTPYSTSFTDKDDMLAEQMSSWMFNTYITLGEIKSAKVFNQNNEVAYEVIYVEALDHNEGSQELVAYPHAGESTHTQGITSLTPPSLDNMRSNLVTKYGYTGTEEMLPEWMSSLQDLEDTNSALGWTPGFVLAYVNAGESARIIQDFSSAEKDNIRGTVILVDRIRSVSSNVILQTTFDSNTTVFEGGTTTFDFSTTATLNKYIKFPQLDVTSGDQLTGDIVGVRPAI